MEEILTADQVATILQVHPFTVLKFIKQGKLKASKLGRVYRIRKSDVDLFLDNQVENKERPPVQADLKKNKKTKIAKVTSPKSDRVEDQGATESKFEKAVEAIKPEVEAEIEEKIPVRNDRNDIDHYIIELKSK